jgi:hypothetical protein
MENKLSEVKKDDEESIAYNINRVDFGNVFAAYANRGNICGEEQ